MARRPAHQPASSHAVGERPWESRIDIVIAVALGLAAIVTAGAVYLNEYEEHKATLDFHEATHGLLDQLPPTSTRPAAGRSRRPQRIRSCAPRITRSVRRTTPSPR